MARIRKTLPGSVYKESHGVGRTARDNKSTTVLAHQIVARRLTQKVQDNIKAKDLIDTGQMHDGAAIDYVSGRNRRMEFSGPIYSAYQEHGTKVLEPNRFIAEELKSKRREWEADVRATKATLDKRVAAAEKKEKPRGRSR